MRVHGRSAAHVAAPRARARARARHARAVRRARHAGRADRGDRPRRRHRARADLPPVLLQGGALRPHRHRLPGRARRPAGRGHVGRARPGRPARGVGARLRRLLPALPGVPRLRAVAHAAARPASCARRVGLRVAAPGPGHRRAASSTLSEILRAGARDGTFTVDDPDYMANVLWTQVLGAMHLARIRVGVRQARAGDPGALHGRARAARATPAWPARWRPSAPSRQARARGAAAAFGRRHALRRAPAGGRVAARADGGRRRRALRRQVPRRRAGARRARGRGRRRRAGAAAGPAGARAGDRSRCAPSWPAPSPTPRSRTCSTPARASTWASTSCPARCRSRRPRWPRSTPSWRPTSCGSTR